MTFACGSVGQGSGIVTAVALVPAVAWVRALAWELSRAMGVAKKKKEFPFLSGSFALEIRCKARISKILMSSVVWEIA